MEKNRKMVLALSVAGLAGIGCWVAWRWWQLRHASALDAENLKAATEAGLKAAEEAKRKNEKLEKEKALVSAMSSAVSQTAASAAPVGGGSLKVSKEEKDKKDFEEWMREQKERGYEMDEDDNGDDY